MATTPTLEDLISQLPPNLGAGIMSPEQQAARIRETQAAMGPELGRKYGAQSQGINEATFGRGMGLSSYNAYQQALNSLMENEAMGKMQLEARNATDAAQRAALGNAVSYATSERNRAQQASEGAANRASAQQMQKRGLNAAGRQQTQSQLYQGLGGLAGGGAGILARDLMRPEGQTSGIGRAYDRAAGAFGGGPKTQGMPSSMSPQELGQVPSHDAQYPSSPPFEPSYGGGLNLSSSGYNFGDSTAGYSLGNFQMPPFETPDFSLDQLLNSSYNWDF